MFFIQLYRWFPSVLKVIAVIRPETLVRWHRAGFRRYWRWKSRSFGGRPQVDAELRIDPALGLLDPQRVSMKFCHDTTLTTGFPAASA
jgi:hypothetical protein